MAVVDTAEVEILPDFTRFDQLLEQGLDNAFREAERLASQAADQIADEFNSAAEDSSRALGDIDPDLTGVVRGATEDLDDVAGAFEDVSEQAEESFREIERTAERTGDEIGDSISAAGERAEDALGEVGDRGEREFDRTRRESDRTSQSMSSDFRRAAGAIAAAFAAVGIGNFIGDAIEQAADLGESINAINVVLGEGADQFVTFGQDAAGSLGITQAALNEAVVPIASLLANADVQGEDLANRLADISTRATDVASVFNADVNEVLEAFGAAIRGETEPARRFGINLNQAAIEAKALELGLTGADGAMSVAARTQAAYALVLEQSEVAAGDFANTIDSWPNLLRRAESTLAETASALGEELLPTLQALGTDGLSVIEELEPTFRSAGAGIADAIQTFEPAIEPSIQLFAALVQALDPLLGIAAELSVTALPPVVAAIEAFTLGATSVLGVIEELPGEMLLAAAAAVALNRALNLLRSHPVVAGITGLVALLGLFTDGMETAEASTAQLDLALSRLARGEIDDQAQQLVGTFADLADVSTDIGDRISAIGLLSPQEFDIFRAFDQGAVEAEAFDEQLKQAVQDFENFDQQLALMASGGEGEQVVRILDTIRESTGLTGAEFQALAERILPDTTAALTLTAEEAEAAADELVTASEAVDEAIQNVQAASDGSALALANLTIALRDSEDAATDAEVVERRLGIAAEDLLEIAPQVATAFEEMAAAVVAVMPSVGTAVADAFSEAQEAEEDFTFRHFVQELEDTLAEAEAFNTNIQALLDAGFDDLAALALEKGPAFAQAAADSLGDPEILAQAEGLMEDIENEVDRGLENAATTAFAGAGDVGNQVVNGVELGLAGLPAATRRLFGTVPEEIRGKGEDVENAGRAVGNRAVTGLRDASGEATTAGESFSSGFASGISGAVQAVIDAAESIANRAVSASRGVIRAQSPSRRTAEEIGLPFVQGIAAGMDEGQPEVDAAFRRIVDGLEVPEFGAAGGLGGGTAAAGVGGRDGVGIGTINVFSSDPDRAGRAVMTEVTDQVYLSTGRMSR